MGVTREVVIRKHHSDACSFGEQGNVLCDFCLEVSDARTIATVYLQETARNRGTNLRYRCEGCALAWKHSPVVKHLSVKEGIALEMAKKLKHG